MTSKIKADVAQDAAKATTEALEAVAAAGKETVERVAKAGAETAAKGYEKTVAVNKANLETVAKSYDELAVAAKDNVEAVVAAGNIAAKGFEAIGAEVMALNKSSLDDGIAATRAVMGAKSYKEIVDLQADFAQASLHNLLSATTKLGEMSLKLTSQVFEPVNARLAASVGSFAKPTSQ